ncbi:MAG: sulfite exporter TauE/SafE family protein [Candidatus Korobacteraceae bacterium]
MHIFLPVAGISINLLLLVAVGAVVGVLTGLLGVGGGFLLTPVLMMIGVPPTVAAASSTNSLVATSSSGVAAHFRLGNVDLKLGSIMLLGGLAGAEVGVQFIKFLRSTGNADFVITVTYVVVLGSVGSLMFIESLYSMHRGVMVAGGSRKTERNGLLQRLPFQMDFPRSNVQHSVLVPFLLCSLVAILAAIMGVGGGFIMVPMMVYLLRMSMHVAIGTDLFQILFTCAGLTLMQAVSNQTVDVVIALLLAGGSTIGAQIGARLARVLRGDQLKIVLATLVLLVTVKMGYSLMVTPSNLLSYAGGQ